MIRLEVVTPSASPILTVAEAQEHLRIDAFDTGQLEAYIAAAEAHIERVTSRKMILAAYRLYLDFFPPRITLPISPINLAGGPPTIQYYDPDGNQQTITFNDLDFLISSPPQVVPKPDFAWPATDGRIDGITVTFVAGYATASDVPTAMIQAAKLLVGDMWENREAAIPNSLSPVYLAVERLLEAHRVYIYGDPNSAQAWGAV